MLHSNFVSVVSLLLGLIESRVEKGVEEGKKLTKMSILHLIGYIMFIMGKVLKISGNKNNVKTVVLYFGCSSTIYCS